MPEVDLDKLRHHVQFVRDTVRRIEEIRARGKEVFLSDRILQDATVRQLQIGIEALVDIANHVIAREGFGVPRSYRESMRLLAEHSILPREKLEAFERMVSFRNRAVHLYDEVDPAEVYAIVAADLGDFEVFLQAVVSKYFG